MISTFLRRACRQTVVYWPAPTNDGYGGFTYGTPRELAARWEDKNEMVKDAQGREVRSSATVFLLDDVVHDGWLGLGCKEDLSAGQLANPQLVAAARQIISFSKTPGLRSDEYVRQAWLA